MNESNSFDKNVAARTVAFGVFVGWVARTVWGIDVPPVVAELIGGLVMLGYDVLAYRLKTWAKENEQ